MQSKQLEGLFALWLAGTLLSIICSGRWLLNGELNIINAINSFNAVQFSAGGGWSVPKGLTAYWNAIVTVLSWNYPWMQSPWMLPFRIIGWILSAGAVGELIKFAVTVIQGIVGLARSIIGG